MTMTAWCPQCQVRHAVYPIPVGVEFVPGDDVPRSTIGYACANCGSVVTPGFEPSGEIDLDIVHDDLRRNDFAIFDEEWTGLTVHEVLGNGYSVNLPEQPTVELDAPGRDWLGILVALVIIILLAVQVILTSMLLTRDTQVDIQFVPATQTAPPPLEA